MSGLFGTNAVLISDLTLIIQIVAFIFLLVALVYKAKGKFKIHGAMMGVAVFVHFISFLVAMGPSFSGGFEFFTTEITQLGVQTTWVHAISGALALALGFFLVLAWIAKTFDVKPCFGRKRIMDATILLWAISLVFGVATYIVFYV